MKANRAGSAVSFMAGVLLMLFASVVFALYDLRVRRIYRRLAR